MFGKSLSEYMRFQKAILILIGVIWAVRLGLSLAGNDGAARWVSVTAVLALGAVYYGVAVYNRGFGSYKQLLPLCLIQGIVSQVLVALGIALAILTGQSNIFTAPEFSPPWGGISWGHVADHVFVAGAIAFPLIGWLLGSIAMFIVRKVSPRPA